MFLSTFWLNRHARQTRGGPVCPPVSKISFDFGKTTAKLPFLQWNHKIREVDLLDRIIRYIMDNTGHTFSANRISKFFKSEGRKVAVDTIVKYPSICENAFLIKKCFKEDLKGKKILKIYEKYYIEDHGFREALIARNTT